MQVCGSRCTTIWINWRQSVSSHRQRTGRLEADEKMKQKWRCTDSFSHRARQSAHEARSCVALSSKFICSASVIRFVIRDNRSVEMSFECTDKYYLIINKQTECICQLHPCARHIFVRRQIDSQTCATRRFYLRIPLVPTSDWMFHICDWCGNRIIAAHCRNYWFTTQCRDV